MWISILCSPTRQLCSTTLSCYSATQNPVSQFLQLDVKTCFLSHLQACCDKGVYFSVSPSVNNYPSLVELAVLKTSWPTILLPVKSVTDNRSGINEWFAGPNKFQPPSVRRSGTWLQHCSLLTQHTPWTNYLDLHFILHRLFQSRKQHGLQVQPSNLAWGIYSTLWPSRYSDCNFFLYQPFQSHKLYGLQPANIAWDIYLTWTTCTLTKWPWAIFHTPVAEFLSQPSRSR